MTSDQPVYHDERVRAAAEAFIDSEACWLLEKLAEKHQKLMAEVARLRAELTAAGEMGRELFQERNRALDAVARLVALVDEFDLDHYWDGEESETLKLARAVLAAHDQEPHDG